jgi:hypothetical protein
LLKSMLPLASSRPNESTKSQRRQQSKKQWAQEVAGIVADARPTQTTKPTSSAPTTGAPFFQPHGMREPLLVVRNSTCLKDVSQREFVQTSPEIHPVGKC